MEPAISGILPYFLNVFKQFPVSFWIFLFGGSFFLALQSFFTSPIDFHFEPRWKRQRASSSLLGISKNRCKSTSPKMDFLKVQFFLTSSSLPNLLRKVYGKRSSRFARTIKWRLKHFPLTCDYLGPYHRRLSNRLSDACAFFTKMLIQGSFTLNDFWKFLKNHLFISIFLKTTDHSEIAQGDGRKKEKMKKENHVERGLAPSECGSTR